jgi:hypothetical protein
LTISGDDLVMATNSVGAALIGDGTNFNPVVVSGDISIAADGTAAIGSTVIVNADVNASAAIVDTKLATISTANKVGLAALDIDGGTELGEAIVDADLFIADNGAGGTNRKVLASRIKTYIGASDVTLANDGDNRVVTGTGSGGLNGEAKLTFEPTALTIGDATAEDIKIVFDGNAQDYHIGLDDAGDYADYLLIGLGSALGTTPYMAIGPTGTVTAPFQPGFSAKAATAQLNIAVGSAVDIVLGTELWDTNADFASNTFTAPISGKYLFTWLINVYYPDAAANAYTIYLTTSNRTYDSHMDPDFGQDQVYWYFSGSMVADMDTSDTAKMQIIQTAGSSQTDIFEDTRFSGILIG